MLAQSAPIAQFTPPPLSLINGLSYVLLTCAVTGAKPDSPAQREAHNQSMKNLQQQKIESRNKVDIFENAFRKIKEATGVSE